MLENEKGTPPPTPAVRGQTAPEFAYARQIFRGWLLFCYHATMPPLPPRLVYRDHRDIMSHL